MSEEEKLYPESVLEEYTRVVEFIGEAAWGVDLPSPMEITFCEPINPLAKPGDPLKKPKIVTVAVQPESYRPVFEAIYQQMKRNPKYKPYSQYKEENTRLFLDNKQLRADCKAMAEALLHIGEYWNRDNNETAMLDALNEILISCEEVYEVIEKYLDEANHK